jgi:hypothetical protein
MFRIQVSARSELFYDDDLEHFFRCGSSHMTSFSECLRVDEFAWKHQEQGRNFEAFGVGSLGQCD